MPLPADEGIEEQLAGFDADPAVAAERKATAKAAVAEAKAARKAAAAAERAKAAGADGDKPAGEAEEEDEDEEEDEADEGAIGALAVLQALRLAAPLPEGALAAAASGAGADDDDDDEDSKGMPTVLQLRQHLRLTAWRLTNNVTVTGEFPRLICTVRGRAWVRRKHELGLRRRLTAEFQVGMANTQPECHVRLRSFPFAAS